jgi:hypothetical protein
VAVIQNVQNLIKLREDRLAGLLKGAADSASVTDVEGPVAWVVRGKRKKGNVGDVNASPKMKKKMKRDKTSLTWID